MKKTKVLAVLFACVLLLVMVMPVGAVTDGDPDGEGHPYVGIMTMTDSEGRWRCSGTLISPTVFLTAGHCTYGAIGDVQVWFATDIDAGRPGNGYPTTGEASGTAYTHPDYDPNAFFLHDVGVVVLHTAVAKDTYGALPDYDQLDAFKTQRGKQDVTFTAVGYGLQKSFPDAAAWKDVANRVRMVAYPKLNQINVPGYTGDFSMVLSNNASTGGTCFGDSGGPNFLGDSNVVAGVTSFGKNGNCAGTGGVFRMDRASALDWVNTFLE